MSLLFIVLAIVLLGIIIMVHELGHFIASRLTGIAVKEFSVGFGPKLFQRRSKKHGTLITLRAIPMGGYCMFYDDTTEGPDGQSVPDPRSYNKTAVWKRMISVFSGPLMNFVLAFVVAAVLLACYGVVSAQPSISNVEPGMPAYEAGLRAGDVFVSAGGQDLAGATVNEVSSAITAGGDGAPVSVTVMRGGEDATFTLTPVYDEETARYRIGIGIIGYAPMPAGMIIPGAWDTCVYASHAILDALGGMFTAGEGLDDIAGPVGVVQLVAQETRKGGLEVFLNLMVIISINLGLINLFPIPGLDGSRLIFMLIEAIRKKPVSQKLEAGIHMAGYALLLSLMVLFTFKDITRMFS